MPPALRDELIAELTGDPDSSTAATAELARAISDNVIAVYQPWLDDAAQRLDEIADTIDQVVDQDGHDEWCPNKTGGECDQGCGALSLAADSLRGLACTLASQEALAKRDTDGALDAAARMLHDLDEKHERLAAAARLALPVLEYVSRGRFHVIGSSEPYPNARARRALAALGDALS